MTAVDQRNQEVLEFWNNRAALGATAGSNDLIAKQLEVRAISSHVQDGMRVLDAGCGNGVTAIEIAKTHDVEVLGLDYAQEMVEAARAAAQAESLKGRVHFREGDISDLPGDLGSFDFIYTERLLINLPDWVTQQAAIARLAELLRAGARYVMCENSQTGLDAINELRRRVGLSDITPPWHNRYLDDREVEELELDALRLEEVQPFSATHYLLSRVINAALAKQEGVEPAYDSPVNQLALRLPAIGDTAQVKIWVWRKVQ